MIKQKLYKWNKYKLLLSYDYNIIVYICCSRHKTIIVCVTRSHCRHRQFTRLFHIAALMFDVWYYKNTVRSAVATLPSRGKFRLAFGYFTNSKTVYVLVDQNRKAMQHFRTEITFKRVCGKGLTVFNLCLLKTKLIKKMISITL